MVLKEKRVNRRGDFGLKVPCEYLRATICSVSGCIGRRGDKFNVFSTDSIILYFCETPVLFSDRYTKGDHYIQGRCVQVRLYSFLCEFFIYKYICIDLPSK